jgi:hypothetical protein
MVNAALRKLNCSIGSKVASMDGTVYQFDGTISTGFIWMTSWPTGTPLVTGVAEFWVVERNAGRFTDVDTADGGAPRVRFVTGTWND